MDFYIIEWAVEFNSFYWQSLKDYKDNLTMLKKNLY